MITRAVPVTRPAEAGVPASEPSGAAEPVELTKVLHETIKKVGEDISNLRFNVAIAELIKLNNEMTRLKSIPRELAETFVLLLAPFAPHIAEEIWAELGHHKSLARRPWPQPAARRDAAQRRPSTRHAAAARRRR